MAHDDEKRMVSLNMFRVNEKFQQKLPEYKHTLELKPAKVIVGSSGKTQAAMAATLASLPAPIETARLTFCGAWPKVRAMLNVALKFAAWIPGYSAQIAMAKAWLTAFNDEIVPIICQPEK